VTVDLHQLSPSTPDGLRAAKKAKISNARGRGRTSRHVFLSADARTALADYLERERPADADDASTALFLSAASIGSRRPTAGCLPDRSTPSASRSAAARAGAVHAGGRPEPPGRGRRR
jgi:site-specific recombinase XerD